jgi:hypothetical protein
VTQELIETEREQPAKKYRTAPRIEFNALDIAFIVEILFFFNRGHISRRGGLDRKPPSKQPGTNHI